MKQKGKILALAMAAAVAVTTLFTPASVKASASSMKSATTFENPMIYSDVPDIDIIRVDDAYYMVSTTMHLSPGCPVMKSTDLVNWEIVNYVYDVLDTGDEMALRNGKSMYGKGQWASSLQYHNGTYYVAFNSNTTGHAYIYTTDDLEKGRFKKTNLKGAYHDMALFFDDANKKTYIVWGSNKIQYVEMNDDLTDEKQGGQKGTLFEGNGGAVPDGGLPAEGTHVMKHGDYYYVFNICWPMNGYPRTEICHRSKTFPSTKWEAKAILNTNFRDHGSAAGVAQGGVIDTKDGKWYGFMFRDHGAIGRTPVLTDCTWKDGWPMLGKNGDGKTVENEMKLPAAGSAEKNIVKSDEFYNDAEHRDFSPVNAASKKVASVKKAAKNMKLAEAKKVELATNGDAETGDNTGWILTRGGGEQGDVQVTDAEKASGKYSVAATNRKNCSSGPCQDFTGKIEKGKTYTVSGKLLYKSGPDTKKFNVGIQNGKNYEYRVTMGTVEAKKGEWTPFTFEYTAADKNAEHPFSSEDNTIFIETPWTAEPTAENDLMDFWMDDFSLTTEQEEAGGDAPGGDTPAPKADDNLVQLITNGGLETGDADGWQVMRTEKAELEVVTEDPASGKYCLKVKNRQSCGGGACQDLSGRLVKGKTYKVTGKVKYTTGPDTKQINVTFENGDNYNWREDLIKIQAKKGEWTPFEYDYTVHDKNDNYPFDSTQNFVFFETPWAQSPSAENDLMDLYIDDFSITTPSDNVISNGSFEGGEAGWTCNENGKVEVKAVENAPDGANAIFCSERKGTGSGPAQDLSNKLTIGNKYSITAYVKYDEGVAEKQFNVTIQNGPDYRYRTVLGSVKAKKGEWTKLTAEYTMPEDAITDQNTIFFETPWVADQTKENDLMDFWVDNVSMIEHVNTRPKDVEEAGENDYNGSNLDLVWQWNHNPNNNNWSLTEREGWLRLKTGNTVSSILDARNTLTQRTYGPTCSGKIKLDVSNMKNGDVAGLASFCYNYGYVAVKKDNTGNKIVMVNAAQNDSKKKDDPAEIESVPLEGNVVYLKVDFNFAGGDKANFFYSTDGKTWKKIGNELAMSYELTHFMGSRFALFNYATKTKGGYADFDYFRVSDDITGASSASSTLKADFAVEKSVSGVMNAETSVKLNMDEIKSGSHKNLTASITIPNLMVVDDVVFNTAAIKGTASYTFKNHRLTITVTGDDVSFKAADRQFATIKCRMNGYASADENVSFAADYISIDGGKQEIEATPAATKLTYLNTGAIAKKLGYSNPLVTQSLGADPYAIVYNDRVYVYMTADDYEYDENGKIKSNSFGYIKTLRVISSDDMLNWTDHGEIKVAGEEGAAKWASHSWAPAIAYKKVGGKDKFFLYFANDASGIGVLEADTPLGPWKDPIGKALLTGQTPGCAGVVWCFDPAVLVDDDGSAYIYFGGGVPDGKQLHPNTARVAKLTDNMIGIEGEAKTIDAPCMFEDSGICKYDGIYYYSYCSNFISPHGDGYPGMGTICYMTSKSPMGPFEYKGEIFQNPSVWFGTGGNNHHATFVYKDKTYFIYHAQTVAKALDETVGTANGKHEQGYRSTHIDNIEFNSNGTIKPIKGTYAGIAQLKTMNPYERIEAETIAWNAGIKTADCKEEGKLYKDYNRMVTDIQDGEWISAAQLAFGERGAEKISVKAASAKGGKIEIRLGSPQGNLVGTVDVSATGGDDTFKTFDAALTGVTGDQNVFLVFKGTADKDKTLMNVDSYQFTESAKQPENPGNNMNPGNNQGSSSSAKPAAKPVSMVGKTFTDSKKKNSYTITGSSEITMTGIADKKLKKVSVPDTVTYNNVTYKVTKIAPSAFKGQKKLTSVAIGNNVTSIGAKAFNGCKKLTSVAIGKNVTSIGAKAFNGCKKLKKVTIKSKNLKKIGKNAFTKVAKKITFKVPKSKKKAYKKLLKKAKTKKYSVK